MPGGVFPAKALAYSLGNSYAEDLAYVTVNHVPGHVDLDRGSIAGIPDRKMRVVAHQAYPAPSFCTHLTNTCKNVTGGKRLSVAHGDGESASGVRSQKRW